MTRPNETPTEDPRTRLADIKAEAAARAAEQESLLSETFERAARAEEEAAREKKITATCNAAKAHDYESYGLERVGSFQHWENAQPTLVGLAPATIYRRGLSAISEMKNFPFGGTAPIDHAAGESCVRLVCGAASLYAVVTKAEKHALMVWAARSK